MLEYRFTEYFEADRITIHNAFPDRGFNP